VACQRGPRDTADVAPPRTPAPPPCLPPPATHTNTYPAGSLHLVPPSLLLTASHDGSVGVWDVATGALVHRAAVPSSASALDVEGLGGTRVALVACSDGAVGSLGLAPPWTVTWQPAHASAVVCLRTLPLTATPAGVAHRVLTGGRCVSARARELCPCRGGGGGGRGWPGVCSSGGKGIGLVVRSGWCRPCSLPLLPPPCPSLPLPAPPFPILPFSPDVLPHPPWTGRAWCACGP
jgi:hypothetical protein